MKKVLCTFIMVCMIILTFSACNNQQKTIVEDKGEVEAIIPIENDNDIKPQQAISENETSAYEQLGFPNDFEEKAYEHVKKIASFGIREAGSDAEAATNQYIMECLKQSGIEAVKEEFDFKYYTMGKVSVNGKAINYDRIYFNPYENIKRNEKAEIYDRSKDQSNKIVLLQGQGTSIYNLEAKTILNIDSKEYEWIKKESSIQVDINGKIDKRKSYNVVATINSPKKTTKCIIISAHMDSINGPGADDNASGVGVALELAKYYASIRNSLPYNIKIVFFGAEEVGLLGAQAYISEHAKELSDCALMFNIDMVGGQQVYIEAGRREQKITCSLQTPKTNLYATTDYESKWLNKEEINFNCKIPDWLKKNIKDCCN